MYFKVLHRTTGFSSMKAPELKRSWRKVEAWHYERPGKATDEGTASVTVETPGLRGHEVKLRLGTVGQSQNSWKDTGSNWSKCNPSCSRDPSTLYLPGPWDDHGDSGRCGAESAVCYHWQNCSSEAPKFFEALETISEYQMSDTELKDAIYTTTGCWFC